MQAKPSSPFPPCLLVNPRTGPPSVDPFPDMLWSRSPFGVSAGSSPAPVSRSGTSYASTLSSYEHSFFFAPQRRTPNGQRPSRDVCHMAPLSPLPDARAFPRLPPPPSPAAPRARHPPARTRPPPRPPPPPPP